ncbi:hypothetical protein ACFE04_003868 [Oxalis oulophora]
MGFLHKLWDETLAGPAPDNGLGKLRKYDSFSGRSSAPLADDSMMISRSITILKRSNSSNYHRSFSGDSVPSSPATSTTPGTPLSPASEPPPPPPPTAGQSPSRPFHHHLPPLASVTAGVNWLLQIIEPPPLNDTLMTVVRRLPPAHRDLSRRHVVPLSQTHEPMMTDVSGVDVGSGRRRLRSCYGWRRLWSCYGWRRLRCEFVRWW